jgi:hypothetical protein
VIKIQNLNPKMLGEPDAGSWLKCPNCGIRFKLTDKSRWNKRRHTTCGQLITFANQENKPEPVWCVVANIAEDIPFGEKHLIQKGTKHFSPGTKIYCYPPLWDTYKGIQVIGRHRGSKQFVTMVVNLKWLENCRVKLVYNPHILKELGKHWDGTEESKKRAENLIEIIEYYKSYNKNKIDRDLKTLSQNDST